MPRLRVVPPDNSGGTTTTKVLSRDASIVTDDENVFSPAVVERVEYDHTGQTSSITSVCGETENRRESDEKPDLTLEGVITEDQLTEAKRLKEGEEITLISDVHQGPVYIKRLTIEQSSDLVSFIGDDGEEKLAFSFSLQLGDPGGSS